MNYQSTIAGTRTRGSVLTRGQTIGSEAALEADPVRRTDLKCGDHVELGESDLSDWVITHPDGVERRSPEPDAPRLAYEQGERPSPPRTEQESRVSLRIDSKIINGTYSTCASQVPSVVLAVRGGYHPVFRFAVKLPSRRPSSRSCCSGSVTPWKEWEGGALPPLAAF